MQAVPTLLEDNGSYGRCTMTEHHGWLYFNETGLTWSLDHPVTSGECPDAANIRPATAAAAVSEMLSAWRALMEIDDPEVYEAACLSAAL